MRKALAAITAFAAVMSISSIAPAASTDGKNRKIVVENASSQSVANLYASPVTSTVWEEDLLGGGTIPAGTSKLANIDNGTNECQYDLRVVMADKSERVKRGVNVCASSKWVIGDTSDVLT